MLFTKSTFRKLKKNTRSASARPLRSGLTRQISPAGSLLPASISLLLSGGVITVEVYFNHKPLISEHPKLPTPSEFYQPDTHSPSQSPRPQFITHPHPPSLFTRLRWLLIALCFHRVTACVTKFKSLTCSLWLSLHPPLPQPLIARADSSVRDSCKYVAE